MEGTRTCHAPRWPSLARLYSPFLQESLLTFHLFVIYRLCVFGCSKTSILYWGTKFSRSPQLKVLLLVSCRTPGCRPPTEGLITRRHLGPWTTICNSPPFKSLISRFHPPTKIRIVHNCPWTRAPIFRRCHRFKLLTNKAVWFSIRY